MQNLSIYVEKKEFVNTLNNINKTSQTSSVRNHTNLYKDHAGPPQKFWDNKTRTARTNETLTILDPLSYFNDSTCRLSFHETAVWFARRFSPPGSASYMKNRRVLRSLTHYVLGSATHVRADTGQRQFALFSDVDKNIHTMLSSIGLQQVPSHQDALESSLKNTTALVYYSIEFAKSCRMSSKKVCKGMNEMPRIIIQTEQILYSGGPIQRHLQGCNELPNCVIWDWSEYHWDLFKSQIVVGKTKSSPNASLCESTLLLPTMFQQRFTSIYKKAMHNSAARMEGERTIDVSFFGKATSRRDNLKGLIKAEFEDPSKNDRQQNNTSSDSPGKITLRYGKLQGGPALVESYMNSKICLIVHAFHGSNVAGEFHRIGDIQESGCRIVMESLPFEYTWTHALERCGGVTFGAYEELPRIIKEYLTSNATSNTLNSRSKIKQWWSRGIQWETILTDVLDLRYQGDKY